ncbi:D-alanine--D-alanine ligase family protein [Actinomadura rupiterrae]|uniref:D-alanine--D-alanine ligase family protein n=1 Tax=Actinomadura rupiterrae TaxID=559627 RepID=UPI0020A42F0B|nr:D-alanine--D-alanine ligase [Actinomadura rupiterrae]MCP2337946.1 D-alanine-D-alanine ligase [Actinomadura rupiterrae]
MVFKISPGRGVVAVCTGGRSRERDRSLLSGAAVAESLRRQGYSVIELDVAAPLFDQQVRKADVAFLAIAGQYAEDGKLQGMLELLDIPYTGSGVLASALAMHKPTAKKLLRRTLARPVEPWLHCTETQPTRLAEAFADDWTSRILAVLKPPVVLKPASQGCSIDLHLAHDEPELHELLTRLAPAHRPGQELLIEPYLAGRHLSVGVLESGEDTVVALPPLEIELTGELYDHATKQHPAHCTYRCPAPLTTQRHADLTRAALAAHQLLGCRSHSRSDFILDHHGRLWWLETNALPGLSHTGNMATMAAAADLDYDTLITRILHAATRADGYRP